MSDPVDFSGDLQDAVDAAQEVTGEDPCRYLGKSLLDDKDARNLARSRIAGLRDVAAVTTWRVVEHRLARGPRQTVIDWLDDRQEELLAMGCQQFDRWLAEAPKADVEPTPSVVQFVAEDGSVSDGRDRGPLIMTPRPGLEAFKERQQAANKPAAVASDGGSDSCPDCDEDLSEHEVGGETGLWCPECGDWRGGEA